MAASGSSNRNHIQALENWSSVRKTLVNPIQYIDRFQHYILLNKQIKEE